MLMRHRPAVGSGWIAHSGASPRVELLLHSRGKEFCRALLRLLPTSGGLPTFEPVVLMGTGSLTDLIIEQLCELRNADLQLVEKMTRAATTEKRRIAFLKKCKKLVPDWKGLNTY
jgi:hypothetical protein